MTSAPNGDALLATLLGLLNESDDLDRTLQASLDMMTTALGGRIGEIWLRSGDAREVELHYSSSDGSPEVVAFEAVGRALGLGSGPSLVSRVVKTGRGSTMPPMTADGLGERNVEALAADVHSALTFPIRTSRGVIGVLVIFREPTERPMQGALDAIPVACHHIGRFLDRVRAESAFHDAAMKLSALASTDALTGLKNRREFDRSLRTVPRQPFAVLSLDVDGLRRPQPRRL